MRIQPPHDARPRRSLHSPQEQQNASSAQASCAAAARHCLRPAKKAARRPFCKRQAARLRAKCAPRMQKRRTRRLPAASEGSFSVTVLRRGGSSLPASRKKGRTPPFLQAPSCAPACEVRPAHAEVSPAPVASRVGTRLQRKRPAPRRLVIACVRSAPAHAESSPAPVTSRIGGHLQRKRPAPRRLVIACVPQKRPHAALFASAKLRACVRSAPRACRSVARAGYQLHRRAASA